MVRLEMVLTDSEDLLSGVECPSISLASGFVKPDYGRRRAVESYNVGSWNCFSYLDNPHIGFEDMEFFPLKYKRRR